MINKYFSLNIIKRNTDVTLKLSPRENGKTFALSKNRRIERKFKMIEYQKRIQDFYKMRDTLITEGYKDNESIIIYDKIEEREIALEIIIRKQISMPMLIFYIETTGEHAFVQYNALSSYEDLTFDEYKLLRRVLNYD